MLKEILKFFSVIIYYVIVIVFYIRERTLTNSKRKMEWCSEPDYLPTRTLESIAFEVFTTV